LIDREKEVTDEQMSTMPVVSQ